MSDKEMRRLLDKLTEDLIRAKRVRATEPLNKTFYSASAWRQAQESVQGYIVRREKELADLKAVSADTALSDDVKAYPLLKFSGISSKRFQASSGPLTMSTIRRKSPRLCECNVPQFILMKGNLIVTDLSHVEGTFALAIMSVRMVRRI